MQQRFWLNRIQQFRNLSIVRICSAQSKKSWLLNFQPTRQSNGGAHVDKRIVSAFVRYIVGCAQVLQAKTGLARFVHGPLDPVRS